VSWTEHVLQFWEGVHKRSSNVHIGNTNAIDYVNYFEKVGPFARDLQKATSVLDVGPGFGRFLNDQRSKDKHAIEISELGRSRLAERGVKACAPGEIGSVGVDLAACLSVVQHCDEPAFKVILADTFRALRPGGRLYMNGIHGGHHTPSPEGLLHGGRCSYSPARVRELAAEAGFGVENDHVYRLGATEIWVFRLRKP